VAVDESNNIYIADTGNNRIREVIASTGVIFTVAGTGKRGFSGDGGAATSAELDAPMSVAVDDSGNIYIADTGNNLIRKVTASTGIISTAAGGLNMPFAVAVDRSDNIYIADTGNFRIRKVTAFTSVASTVAGNGSTGSLCNKGGEATTIGLGLPTGIAVDTSGNLYLSTGYEQVCEVTASGIVSALAGTSNAGYSGDGGAAVRAALNSPDGVWVDTVGNVYIADTFNNRIRMITASTGVISTVAGNGATGYSGDGGAATNAELNEPFSVTTDARGNVYIADQKNNCVRMVQAPTS
jgi:sugar lactone lactonase YvrE